VNLKDAVVVPTSLIRQDVEGSYVYIVQEASAPVAKRVYLKTGRSDGSFTVVESGLTGGEKIISQGYNRVKQGTLISY
jgi:membrane fusion protein, multidrug efflux system